MTESLAYKSHWRQKYKNKRPCTILRHENKCVFLLLPSLFSDIIIKFRLRVTPRSVLFWPQNTFSKTAETENTGTAEQARTHWRECDCNKWVGTKPRRLTQIHPSINTPNSMTFGWFISLGLGLMCLKKRLVLTETNHHSRLSCSEHLLLWFSDKVFTYSQTEKILIEAPATTKNKDVRTKCLLRTRTAFHWWRQSAWLHRFDVRRSQGKDRWR